MNKQSEKPNTHVTLTDGQYTSVQLRPKQERDDSLQGKFRNWKTIMIRIKVLGSGSRFCEMMEQVAVAGLMDLIDKNPDIRASIEHIEDLEAINKYPILVTPGLVINEHLACAG